jgi:hypothetical protein
MNKPYNIQNTNICNGIFHILFFKALLINEGEATRGERESGRTGIGAKRLAGRNDPDSLLPHVFIRLCLSVRSRKAI